MIKSISFVFAALLLTISGVQAAEQAAPAAAVKGTKSYQSRAISNVRPSDEQSQPADPAAVEPAAGAEAQGETAQDPARDTTSNLQDQMRLPRKN